MSVEPPSSGRPTGPPSGPLSGPGQPPSGPPSQPPGGDSGAPEPRRPWWRSAPRVALLTTAVVAAVVLAVVFTRPDGGTGAGSGGEVLLQAAGESGPDPFTESTAKDSSAPPVTPSPATESTPPNAVLDVNGGAPGLYGGTRNVASCDVERQIRFLQGEQAKNRAFAGVLGVEPAQVPDRLRALTPVQLRADTRVTNHGYRDGRATSYQAVLQAGTAVLVDERGVPRVRCACGNPLTRPVLQRTAPRTTGEAWPSYRSSNVVVVTPAPTVIKVFKVYDPDRGDWFARPRGDTGGKDRKTEPPAKHPTPSASVSTPTGPPAPPTTEPPAPEPPTPEPETTEPPPEDSPAPESPPAPDTTTQPPPESPADSPAP